MRLTRFLSRLSEKIRRLPPEKRKLIGLIFVYVISGLISIGVFSIPFVNVLEWKISDTWIGRTGNTVPNKDIAVIGIDEDFMKAVHWPVDKEIYATVLGYLASVGAKVIVFDVLFSHNTNLCDQADDVFKQYLSIIPNTVLIYSPMETAEWNPEQTSVLPPMYSVGGGIVPGYNVTKAILPYEELMATGCWIGHHILSEPFKDGYYRQLPLLISSGGHLFPTLSLLSVHLFNDSARISWDKKDNLIRIGDDKVKVDARTQLMVDFKHEIPEYRLSDLIESIQAFAADKTPKLGEAQFKDRIIFIGASDPLIGDNALMPIPKDKPAPKVMMHARSAATIMNNSGIRYFGRTGAILFSLVLMFMMLALFRRTQVITCYISLLVIAGLTYLAGGWLYNIGYLIPIAEGIGSGLIFTLLGSLVIFMEKDLDRSFLFDSFKTYLSEAVIEDMYKRQVKPKLGGSEGIRTAYFTDIQSFSTFSEKIGSPTRLVELLNEYLSAMTDILLENHGTLDKYEGDAIIAFFGAPVEMPDHAAKACIAAIRMQEKLGDLRAKWKSEGGKWPDIVHYMRMRIGINTGPLVTGNMGSHVRMNYTMMGDAVNLAARLESGAKQYGVFTLVSGETMSQASRAIYGRQIDRIRVVGKSDPVEIWEVMGLKENITPEHMRLIGDFKNGRRLYIEQNWDEATAAFTRCLEMEPHHPDREEGCKTTPSHVYLARCESYRANPPGEGWDGVYTATEK